MQIGVGIGKHLRVAVDLPGIDAATVGAAISRVGVRAARQIRRAADAAAERTMARMQGRKTRKK